MKKMMGFTTETFCLDDAGVTKVIQQKTIPVERQEEYVKLYLGEIERLFRLTQQETALCLFMAKYVSYCQPDDSSGGVVDLNCFLRKEFCAQLGVPNNRVSHLLINLVSKEILFKLGRGRYRLSPFLFAKGNWSEVKKVRIITEIERGNGTATLNRMLEFLPENKKLDSPETQIQPGFREPL